MRLVLDFADSPGHVIRRTFLHPATVLTAYRPEEVPALFAALDDAIASGAHAAGFISYECAPAFDPAAQVQATHGFPLARFGIYAAPEAIAPPDEGATLPLHYAPWILDIREEDYARAIQRIHDAIRRGDTYQINYTVRARSRLQGSGLQYYERLRLAQRADYCAWIDCDDLQILSLSPELFFSKEGDQVITRPMKGTVQRGIRPEEDRALADWLAASRKNRAENLMIVDLLRNDLSRIAQPGTVRVPALFTIERYPTLLQMTSTVAATLRPDVSLFDLFSALFPCGSITGAPKLKSMELIRELESSRRGPYCGAIGWIRPGGRAQFNVAIRTLLQDKKTGEMTCGLGGGITWDSRSGEEYAEVLTKSRFLDFNPQDFELLETMRLEDGAFWLLPYHLERLHLSASVLGFPTPTDALQSLLAQCAAQYPSGTFRVRLRYSREGNVHLEAFTLHDPTVTPVTVVRARVPVSSPPLFLQHKTTRRSHYTHCAADVLQPEDYDVLLWNALGEATEFTRGNLVFEMQGMRFTPPLGSGLLPGTFRRHLLETGAITERPVLLEDLSKADRLWFINSVRGWVPVTLRHDLRTQS